MPLKVPVPSPIWPGLATTLGPLPQQGHEEVWKAWVGLEK